MQKKNYLDIERRKTIISLLQGIKRTPREHQLEEITQVLKVHYGLYKQEGDAEGMALYRPLVDAATHANSIEALESVFGLNSP